MPVAKVYHLCEDTSIIGSMFYVMEYVMEVQVLRHLEEWVHIHTYGTTQQHKRRQQQLIYVQETIT